MSARGELQKLMRKAHALGIRIERTRSGHFRFICPDGRIEIVGSTPRRTTVSAVLRLFEQQRRAAAEGASP